MEDNQGNLWFSTKGKGLVKAEPDNSSKLGFRFTRFMNEEDNPNSISSNEVYCSYQDSKGRIWAGLFGGGLNLLEEENGRVIFRHKYNCFSYYPSNGMVFTISELVTVLPDQMPLCNVNQKNLSVLVELSIAGLADYCLI